MKRVAHIAFIAITLYATWLGMEAVHELGHVLAAWLTGGHVQSVSIPLLGTSQTIVDPNPLPRDVAWGGVQWGSAMPALACGLAILSRRRAPEALKFFTGFCLIANGSYLAVGAVWPVGDARDLLRLNVPRYELILVGATLTICGLLIWHRLKWLTWQNTFPKTPPH